MAANTIQELREDLRKDLECPVCLDFPDSTPIFQCIQGHIVCNSCHPKLKSCPVCRAKVDIRALTVEKILPKILPKCKHQNCPVFKTNIKEHEAICTYALVDCTHCKTQITIKDLDTHESICPLRKVKCGLCDEPVVFRELQDHDEICEFRTEINRNTNQREKISPENLTYVQAKQKLNIRKIRLNAAMRRYLSSGCSRVYKTDFDSALKKFSSEKTRFYSQYHRFQLENIDICAEISLFYNEINQFYSRAKSLQSDFDFDQPIHIEINL